MAKQVPNSRWVTKVIADSFETIQAHAPPEYIPAIDRVHPDRTRLTATLRTYGCGGYGCVIATADLGVVLKLTTDDTEVAFARDLEPHLVVPVSVEYYLALRTRHLFRDRPVVLLWREAAADVGRLKQIDMRSWRMVDNQHRIAQEIFLRFHGGAVPADIPREIGEWRQRCEAMLASPSLAWLGEGLLRNYDERGIFFGDVHAGNLGRVERDGEVRWVITDPGHVVVVSEDGPPAPAPDSIPWPESGTPAPNPRGCKCVHANPGRCRHDHADPNNWSRFEISDVEHAPGGPYIETRTCRCGATVTRELEEDVGETLWGAVNVPLAERFGDRKVFLSDAWRQARIEWLAADPEVGRDAAHDIVDLEDRSGSGRLRSMSMDEWKDLMVEWQREGKVQMARADLVAAMDPAKVAGSEIDARGATFHFIIVPPAG